MNFTPDEILEIKNLVGDKIFSLSEEASRVQSKQGKEVVEELMVKSKALYNKVDQWFSETIILNKEYIDRDDKIKELEEAINKMINLDCSHFYKVEMLDIAKRAKAHLKSSESTLIECGYEVADRIIRSVREIEEEANKER